MMQRLQKKRHSFEQRFLKSLPLVREIYRAFTSYPAQSRQRFLLVSGRVELFLSAH